MASKIREMTVAEYFAFDEASEIRNEYIDGDIIPMTGGTGNHAAIIAYTIAAFVNALGNRNCIVRSSDMRVRIDASRYVYPDVSVVCGEAEYEDSRDVTLLNPTIVVEVTSPSSIAYDHVDKLGFYSDVPSIGGYLILDQERVYAEWHSRTESGWHVRQFSDLKDIIPLEPLDCELPLGQVYRGLKLPA